MELPPPPYELDVTTPLGLRVVCTPSAWDTIVRIKHPVMSGRLVDVIATVTNPHEVRRSVSDGRVLLFYRQVPPRWVCAVTKHVDGGGFLITAYPTDKIKSGELVWRR